jgi:peptide/nickel transport system substrate-binding protein
MLPTDRRAFLLGSSVALLVAAGLRATDAAAQGSPGALEMLRVAHPSGGSGETIDPYAQYTGGDYYRLVLVHDPLMEMDVNVDGGYAYRLAESVEPDETGSTYTIRLRPGLTFSDGSPLTAADVKASLERSLLGPSANFLAVFDPANATSPDPLTLVLPTVAPIGDGIGRLGFSLVITKADVTEFTTEAPVSGAYRVTGFEAGVGSTLERVPDYAFADQRGFASAIELRSLPDEEARFNALIGGQVDIALDLSAVQAEANAGNSAISFVESSPPLVEPVYFRINTGYGPFVDPRVRQALALACDREALVANALLGRGIVGNELLWPGMEGFAGTDVIPQRPYDPEAAQALLAEAGVTDLSFDILVEASLPGMVEATTLYTEQLKAIGVNAVVSEVPVGQLFADFAVFLEAPMAVASAGVTPLTVGYDAMVTGFQFIPPEPALVAELERAKAATDATERITALQAFQRLVHEGVYMIVPYFRPSIHAHRSGLTGFERISGLNVVDLARISAS